MEPVGSLSAAGMYNGNNPPLFITGKMIKKRYADYLRMWIKMMGSYNSFEKLKFELINAGFKIFRSCDEQERGILDEERSSGILNLKGDDDRDPL